MPMKSTPMATVVHLASLRDQSDLSFRELSKLTNVPKSTIHDNIDFCRAQLARFEEWHKSSDRRTAEVVLRIAMEGKASARSTAEAASGILGLSVSRTKVREILADAATIADLMTQQFSNESRIETTFLPLAMMKCVGSDEIFQNRHPILAVVDLMSGYVRLQAHGDRSAESWIKFFADLKSEGLAPLSWTTDGGQSQTAAVGSEFPGAVLCRDLFHLAKKVTDALKAALGAALASIAAYDSDPSPERESLMNRRIDFFDRLEKLADEFLRSQQSHGKVGFVTSEKLAGIIDELVALLKEMIKDGRFGHRAIGALRSYLERGKKTIVAYKKMVEDLVREAFGDLYDQLILDFIVPIIECLDQLLRSGESVARRKIWEEKIAVLRRNFSVLSYVDDRELNAAIDRMVTIMSQVRRSNSLIEAVNSVIRRYLVSHKTIPSWFCSLFSWYWNHRRFTRGKRKGLKPCEILTMRHEEADWLSPILDQMFPPKTRKEAELQANQEHLAVS